MSFNELARVAWALAGLPDSSSISRWWTNVHPHQLFSAVTRIPRYILTAVFNASLLQSGNCAERSLTDRHSLMCRNIKQLEFKERQSDDCCFSEAPKHCCFFDQPPAAFQARLFVFKTIVLGTGTSYSIRVDPVAFWINFHAY